MARSFRRPRSSHPIAELNVTNLIDLGFMLLIIFMIVANPTLQKEQSIPVNLPTVSKNPPPPADSKDVFVVVGVDSRGRFYVDNRNQPIGISELRSRLHAYAAATKQPVIRIRGDAAANLQPFADLLNEIQKAGLTRISFDAKSVE